MTERLTRAQQQARTREKLLDSAEMLFGEKGIHQTSLDEIAGAAGLTKGAVYANFGGKKDLIAAIVARKIDDDEPVRPRMSMDDYLEQAGRTWEENVPTPEVRRFAMAFMELWLHGMRSDGDREALREWMRTVRGFHARDAEDLGLDGDPKQTAALMLALDIGIGLQYMLDPEEVPAHTYTRGIEKLLRPRGERP